MRRPDPTSASLRPAARIAVAAFLLVSLAIAASGAKAQSNSKPAANPRDLQQLEERLRQRQKWGTRLDWRSRELARDIAALRQNLVRTARFARTYERELLDIESELGGLIAKERSRRKVFLTRRNQLGQILATLQRISLYPPESLIVMPGRANDTVRSALVMRALVPQLERRAEALRGELDSMAGLRNKIERRRARLKAANKALEERREELASLLKRQSKMLNATVAEKRALKTQISTLAARASSLRDLMKKLDSERRIRAKERTRPKPSTRTAALTRPSALRRFSAARGKLTLPVAGRVTKLFGQASKAGQASKGIELSGRRGAPVVAPYDGQVVFAGRFRGYGRILIIEHSEGYHTLIAGLTRIDVAVKQWVLASEPVGAMDESRAEVPRLYLEIRHKGRPINPLPWMAADKSKAKG